MNIKTEREKETTEGNGVSERKKDKSNTQNAIKKYYRKTRIK